MKKKISLKDAVRRVKKEGKHGDTMLAHINPKEAKMLKKAGGIGTKNKETGLNQYFGLGYLTDKSFIQPGESPQSLEYRMKHH